MRAARELRRWRPVGASRYALCTSWSNEASAAPSSAIPWWLRPVRFAYSRPWVAVASGYELAAQFGLGRVTARRAGLVPLMFSDHTPRVCASRLSGLALPVKCQLSRASPLSRESAVHPSGYERAGDLADLQLLGARRQHLASTCCRQRMPLLWLIEALKREQPVAHLKTVLTLQAGEIPGG